LNQRLIDDNDEPENYTRKQKTFSEEEKVD